MRIFDYISASQKLLMALFVAGALTACTTSQDPATRTDGINDPYEATNRSIHEFNKGLDKNLVRPASKGYAAVFPVEIRNLVNNFSENLGMPGVAINSLLQGDFKGVGLASTRFVMNSTIGLGGLIDAASEFTIPEHDTDFGETLAVWGVGEGAYVELPVLGPSTQRDTVGYVVDLFTNPLTFFTISGSPEQFVPPATQTASWLNDRDQLSGTIDSILYDSADSYAQTRSIYLQNRRFELEGSGAQELDPYLDPYAE